MTRHGATGYTKVTGDYLAQTRGAVLIEQKDYCECWIPKSVIEDSDAARLDCNRPQRGSEVSFYVREWFAYKNGLT